MATCNRNRRSVSRSLLRLARYSAENAPCFQFALRLRSSPLASWCRCRDHRATCIGRSASPAPDTGCLAESSLRSGEPSTGLPADFRCAVFLVAPSRFSWGSSSFWHFSAPQRACRNASRRVAGDAGVGVGGGRSEPVSGEGEGMTYGSASPSAFIEGCHCVSTEGRTSPPPGESERKTELLPIS